MIPLFLTLPLIIYGLDLRLFGILVSAYFTGLVIEDFFWFVLNPVVSIKEFNPKFANYYPWLNLGFIKIPVSYILALILAFLSYYFIWG
tara:strand:- start:29648 stop:29914 length:267 start_codon:yes stop_codon:yes gene_type:complete